ncbi:MAG TPA: hypothetical protein VLY63_14515, partial [Anaerolineae bacterium]|nr:hypothetical protein [Anaerolineae bacterium]
MEAYADPENDRFSTDGSRVLIGESVYDTATGKELVQMIHRGGTIDKSLNSDGSLVLSTGWDGRARLWDVASGDPLRSFSHELVTHHATWNDDERRILTSSGDRTARVWDAASADLLFILPNNEPIHEASWSPDESRILTVNDEGIVTVYYASADELLEAACERALRNMTPEQWKQFMGDEPFRATCPGAETRAARVAPTPTGQPSTETRVAQSAETPAPAPTPVPVEPTETPSPSFDLLPFEDEAGIFAIDHPSALDQIDPEVPENYDYGYTFSASDGSAAMAVLFHFWSEPFGDADWAAFVNEYTEISNLDTEFDFGPAAVELDRWVGEPGEHYACVEIESEESHGLICIEEAGGMITVVLAVAEIEQWPEMQEAMVESLDSFRWSPEAIEALLPAEPTPSAADLTPTAVAEATTQVNPSPTPTQVPARLSGSIVFPVFDPRKSLGGQAGGYDLWVSDPDGNGRKLLVRNASQPHLNQDGDLLAYRSWEPSRRGIATLSLGGGGSELLTGFIEDGLPSWSPDSASIAFASRREGDRAPRLYRLSGAGGEVRWLGVLAQYVSTLPNGRLAFKGCTADNTTCGMFITGPDGGALDLLSDNPSDTAPAPSPDGAQIAFMSFEREGADNWEIYVMSSSGGQVTRLTDNQANDGLPAWSPDGRTLAFASNRDGAWAIWAMNPDGSNQRKLFNMGGSPDGVTGFDPD